MTTIRLFKLSGFLCLLPLLSLLGCGGGGGGPELAQVSGVVILDGNPIEGAEVTFSPVGEGRGSIAITDAEGQYTLQYTNDRSGAIVGEHTVSITTAREAFSDESGEGKDVEGRAEMLPPRYHNESELTRTVDSGSNTIDFELTSD